MEGGGSFVRVCVRESLFYLFIVPPHFVNCSFPSLCVCVVRAFSGFFALACACVFAVRAHVPALSADRDDVVLLTDMASEEEREDVCLCVFKRGLFDSS